jgi:Transposase
MTLLRLIRAPALPRVDVVLGVDEFVLRRDHTYATVLDDLETQRPVDVLDDHTADALAAWLKDHPDLKVVRRDRADPCADGATRGALRAVQVADRWHLLHNLADVVERVAKRRRVPWPRPHRPSPNVISRACHGPAVVEGCGPPLPGSATPRSTRWPTAASTSSGSVSTSASIPRLCAATCARLGPEGAAGPTAQRATALDSYKPYLTRRFAQGRSNAARLWAEIRQQGYRGSRRSVRRYLNTLRLRPASGSHQ